MKRKLLLVTLLVALFVCIFAISVSAAEYTSDYTNEVTKFYDGETEIGPDWANIDDKTSTAVLKKADGTFVRVPVYYIFKANSSNKLYEKGDNFDFEWVSQKLDEENTLTIASLVVLEIPYGTKEVDNLLNYTALEEVVFPTTATGFPKNEGHGALKKVFAKQTRNADGTISGITSISDYSFKNIKTLEYFKLELDYATYIGNTSLFNTAIEEIRIEGPITGIGASAFASCTSLATVYINNTSNTIVSGSQIFNYTTNLADVTLNSVGLPEYTFQNSNALTNGGLKVVATNVGAVGQMAFKNTTSLSNVKLTGVTSLGGSVFLNCSNLKNVEISGPITKIGSTLFNNSKNVETLIINNTLESPVACGNNLLDGATHLVSVNLNGISIDGYSFRQVTGSQEMTFRATNVGYIGEAAFYKSGFKEIYISGPFTSIGNSTYRECPNLVSLTVINTGDTYVTAGNGESNPVLTDLRIEGKFKIQGTPVFQNNTALKHVYLGEGVHTIGTYVFYQCYALETMYLADTIEVIADRGIDMNNAGKQTSESFMFVDENGNMDNTLPTSLKTIGGHFLKHFKIANTQLIFPEGFTYHNSEQKYDFEGTSFPNGFSLVYLGKMTAVNLHMFYKHNNSKELTVYLTQNSSSDIKNYRVKANVSDTGEISHGAYAGVNPNGTLEIYVDDALHNNIKSGEYIKFYFCSTNEVCFVTRVNILWGENTASSWGNFVSTPVTYEQLVADMQAYNNSNGDKTDATIPQKHPIVDDGNYYAPTCENEGGVKYLCVCGTVVRIENVEPSLGGHLTGNDIVITYPLKNGITNYFANAIISCTCQREGCGAKIEEEKANSALFIAMGMTLPESERASALCHAIKINLGAVKDYNAYLGAGNEIKYGVIAGIVVEGNKPLNADGTLAENIIALGFETTDFSIIQMKLTGLEKADKQLYCGAYAIVGDDVTYLYEGTVKDEATPLTVNNGILDQTTPDATVPEGTDEQ